MVVHWNKWDKAKSECTSHNFVVLAIFIPKIIKVGRTLMKLWQINYTYFFLGQGVYCIVGVLQLHSLPRRSVLMTLWSSLRSGIRQARSATTVWLLCITEVPRRLLLCTTSLTRLSTVCSFVYWLFVCLLVSLDYTSGEFGFCHLLLLFILFCFVDFGCMSKKSIWHVSVKVCLIAAWKDLLLGISLKLIICITIICITIYITKLQNSSILLTYKVWKIHEMRYA